MLQSKKKKNSAHSSWCMLSPSFTARVNVYFMCSASQIDWDFSHRADHRLHRATNIELGVLADNTRYTPPIRAKGTQRLRRSSMRGKDRQCWTLTHLQFGPANQQLNVSNLEQTKYCTLFSEDMNAELHAAVNQVMGFVRHFTNSYPSNKYVRHAPADESTVKLMIK